MANAAPLPTDSDNTDGSIYEGMVLLTGFGPFGNVVTNPSYEVVRTLVQQSAEVIVDEKRYLLKAPDTPVPVTYSAVDEAAAAGGHYGTEADACLVVHVGVGVAAAVVLERQACNEGYSMPGCDGVLPCRGGVCVPGAPDILKTSLDLVRVRDSAKVGRSVDIAVSTDAGRYLCEYIYFKSLQAAESKCAVADESCPIALNVLFVHIPPLDQPYTLEALVDTLRAVVQGCIIQLPQQKHQVDEFASLLALESKAQAASLLRAHAFAPDAAAASFFEAQQRPVTQQTDGPISQQDVESLQNMGFDEATARAALVANGGDIQAAADTLLSGDDTTQ